MYHTDTNHHIDNHQRQSITQRQTITCRQPSETKHHTETYHQTQTITLRIKFKKNWTRPRRSFRDKSSLRNKPSHIKRENPRTQICNHNKTITQNKQTNKQEHQTLWQLTQRDNSSWGHSTCKQTQGGSCWEENGMSINYYYLISLLPPRGNTLSQSSNLSSVCGRPVNDISDWTGWSAIFGRTRYLQ